MSTIRFLVAIVALLGCVYAVPQRGPCRDNFQCVDGYNKCGEYYGGQVESSIRDYLRLTDSKVLQHMLSSRFPYSTALQAHYATQTDDHHGQLLDSHSLHGRRQWLQRNLHHVRGPSKYNDKLRDTDCQQLRPGLPPVGGHPAPLWYCDRASCHGQADCNCDGNDKVRSCNTLRGLHRYMWPDVWRVGEPYRLLLERWLTLFVGVMTFAALLRLGRSRLAL